MNIRTAQQSEKRSQSHKERNIMDQFTAIANFAHDIHRTDDQLADGTVVTFIWNGRYQYVAIKKGEFFYTSATRNGLIKEIMTYEEFVNVLSYDSITDIEVSIDSVPVQGEISDEVRELLALLEVAASVTDISALVAVTKNRISTDDFGHGDLISFTADNSAHAGLVLGKKIYTTSVNHGLFNYTGVTVKFSASPVITLDEFVAGAADNSIRDIRKITVTKGI